MKRFLNWSVYLIVRLFICAIQALRLETCAQIAGALAFLANDVFRLRGKVVQANLRQALPDWTDQQRRQAARAMWRHLFLMVCEIAHAPRKIHDTNWNDYLRIGDKRRLVKYLLEPRSSVLISGHFGNFEIASFTAGLLGIPTYAIARTLDNPYINDFIHQFRSKHGQYILPKDGSAGQVEQVLEDGGVIALLGDQSAGSKGCWIEFLGRPASYHKAVALFTLSNEAPLLVCYAKRLDQPLHFEVGLQAVADPRLGGAELKGVKSLVQWYNDALEEMILQTPEQYWWVHRRWKGEPPAKRSRKKTPAHDSAPAETLPTERKSAA